MTKIDRKLLKVANNDWFIKEYKNYMTNEQKQQFITGQRESIRKWSKMIDILSLKPILLWEI